MLTTPTQAGMADNPESRYQLPNPLSLTSELPNGPAAACPFLLRVGIQDPVPNRANPFLEKENPRHA